MSSVLGGRSVLGKAPVMTSPELVLSEPPMRDFGDPRATRDEIYGRVLAAAKTMPPVQNSRHILRLRDVDYADRGEHSLEEQKQAIMANKTLGRRLVGTWELLDRNSGQVLDSKTQTVAKVPYFTDRNTVIHNGVEYTISNQLRLRPGVFTRVRNNGEIEAHVNIMPGKGVSHRYFLDPEKSVFNVRVHQAKVPLLPLLRAMGATDKQLIEAWGPEIWKANAPLDTPASLMKLFERLLPAKDLNDPNVKDRRQRLAEFISNMPLDSEVTGRTLRKPYDKLSLDAILDSTKKLLAISRGEDEVDDRDNLAYQTVHGPEDLLAERFEKDYGRLRQQLLHKASFQGNLKSILPGALTRQLDSVILTSGLGMSPEEINPSDILDKQSRITRMGEGGIESAEAVPDEARSVQPSHFSFIDPVRTPESGRVGIDTFIAASARKGLDGKIYTPVIDVKTGKMVYKTPQELTDSVVAFPGELNRPEKRVQVMSGGKLGYAKKDAVQYVPPDFEGIFSPLANLIPGKSAAKQGRMAMGARYLTQALPLVKPESPLFQAATHDNPEESYEERYGTKMGAIRAPQGGKVLSINDNRIRVQYDNGEKADVELHRYWPYNRKTMVHNTPMIEPGQRFESGQLLAKSNYTDDKGTTALGVNLNIGYLPFRGLNFEDAVVVSESAANKKLVSEHLYQNSVEFSDDHKRGKRAFIGLFPSKYKRTQLDTLDDDGVVKPGTVLKHGDPIFLLAKENPTTRNKVHKKQKSTFADASETWEHHADGLVTDVFKNDKGLNVLVKSEMGTQVGDKLSGRYGDKGVIAAIIPDDEMPRDSQGRPLEILVSPLGTISRTNPIQAMEAGLGKLAEKLGKAYKLKDFTEEIDDLTDWTIKQLKPHGIPLYEDLEDPETGRKIPGILTGKRFFMKLHHTAESKAQGRSTGGYTMDATPAKGGPEGAKRISLLDSNALLAHGATETLRDAGAFRGQRMREDMWLNWLQGRPLGKPKVPVVYEKFLNQLRGAGINVLEDGPSVHIMAMTDKDVDRLAEDRVIANSDTVALHKGLEPIKGGLFDPTLTGGHNGDRWASMKLVEPMPNPVMEEPIRRMLGLTKNKFEAILSGKEGFQDGSTGPGAIAHQLDKVDIDKEIEVARAQIASGRKTYRDQAVRKLGYLKAAKKLGLHPRDWIMSKVPVLPPRFRPVAVMSDKKIPLVADANYLYQELFEANKNLESMKQEVDDVADERLAVYHAFRAVTGLGDPVHPKLREKNISGLLKQIFSSSPKMGTVQRRLLGSTVDLVGRSVITPNPDLDMDHIGLPESKAWEIYRPFIVRRLRRRGLPLVEAFKQAKDKTDLAKTEMLKEMDERPVLANRAPVLHRHGILAFKPRLVKGDTLQLSPLVVGGFNADFDGDAMQYHVPLTDEARDEYLEKLLPSRNLISSADFKSPVHKPTQDYTAGLFFATSAHRKGGRKQTFRNSKDVLAALMRGELDFDEVVELLD